MQCCAWRISERLSHLEIPVVGRLWQVTVDSESLMMNTQAVSNILKEILTASKKPVSTTGATRSQRDEGDVWVTLKINQDTVRESVVRMMKIGPKPRPRKRPRTEEILFVWLTGRTQTRFDYSSTARIFSFSFERRLPFLSSLAYDRHISLPKLLFRVNTRLTSPNFTSIGLVQVCRSQTPNNPPLNLSPGCLSL